MKNLYNEVEREWDASFYDDEFNFNARNEVLSDSKIFASNSEDDEKDENADSDWGFVDPLEDGIPSDNDPSGPGSAV